MCCVVLCVVKRDNVITVVTQHGGHLGFFEGGSVIPNDVTWLDRCVVEYCKSLLHINAQFCDKSLSVCNERLVNNESRDLDARHVNNESRDGNRSSLGASVKSTSLNLHFASHSMLTLNGNQSGPASIPVVAL